MRHAVTQITVNYYWCENLTRNKIIIMDSYLNLRHVHEISFEVKSYKNENTFDKS